jgi:hypothetical protein
MNTEHPVKQTEIVSPIQVAQRGFERALTLDWIHSQIESAIESGALGKPVHELNPGSLSIPVHFGLSLIETWRFQFDRGHRIEIPRALWKRLMPYSRFPDHFLS